MAKYSPCDLTHCPNVDFTFQNNLQNFLGERYQLRNHVLLNLVYSNYTFGKKKSEVAQSQLRNVESVTDPVWCVVFLKTSPARQSEWSYETVYVYACTSRSFLIVCQPRNRFSRYTEWLILSGQITYTITNRLLKKKLCMNIF